MSQCSKEEKISFLKVPGVLDHSTKKKVRVSSK